MRIVGGALKGRGLAGPAAQTRALRPTSDRARETVFNIIEHGIEGYSLSGAMVLDLFAGTGALGFEALSRGATFCLFVEQQAIARGLIRESIERFELGGKTKLYRRDATKLGSRHGVAPASLVFADPPYGRGLGEKALASAADGGWLEDGAVAVLEESARSTIEPPPGFIEIGRREMGDTMLVFMRFEAEPAPRKPQPRSKSLSMSLKASLT